MTQAVLATLCTKMKTFTYDPSLSFRGWLRTLTHHTWSDLVARRRLVLAGGGQGEGADWLESIEARDDLMELLNEQFDHELLDEAIVRVRLRVEPHTWEAFRLTAFEAWPAPPWPTASDQGRHRLQGQEQGAKDASRRDPPPRGTDSDERRAYSTRRTTDAQDLSIPRSAPRLLADQLGALQESSIGDHVEDCPLCQESLEQLTVTDIRPAVLVVEQRFPGNEIEAEVDTDFLHSLKCDPPPSVFPGDRRELLARRLGWTSRRYLSTRLAPKAMKSSPSWAGAEWGSSTRPGSCG